MVTQYHPPIMWQDRTVAWSPNITLPSCDKTELSAWSPNITLLLCDKTELSAWSPNITLPSCDKTELSAWSIELTTRFGCESVRLIPRDLGHCPRQWSRRGQWARSRGINPDSHTKRVDNSGSATTVLATKYLYIDAKCLLLSKRWVLFLTCRPSLLFWSRDTNRPISIKKMGLLPCQLVVVPAKMLFWDYCPASRV